MTRQLVITGGHAHSHTLLVALLSLDAPRITLYLRLVSDFPLVRAYADGFIPVPANAGAVKGRRHVFLRHAGRQLKQRDPSTPYKTIMTSP